MHKYALARPLPTNWSDYVRFHQKARLKSAARLGQVALAPDD